MKIIAFGFLLTPDPYLGDVYNFLDLFLLILDALFLVPSWNPTQLVVVRILSAFRPLRMLCRIQGMKVLTTNLLRTIPAVMSVLAFTFIVFSVFAVVGVQLFRGRFSSCNASVDHHINCVGNDLTTAQILGPRVWANPSFHFDNFPSALLSLFIISTFDNVQASIWAHNLTYQHCNFFWLYISNLARYMQFCSGIYKFLSRRLITLT